MKTRNLVSVKQTGLLIGQKNLVTPISTYVDSIVEDLQTKELRIVVAAQLQNLINCHVCLLVSLEIVHDTVCILHL